MNKNRFVPELVAILVITALLAGCDEGNKTPTEATSPAMTTIPTATATTAPFIPGVTPTPTATATAQPRATPTATPTRAPAATATPTKSGDTLSEILGRAQNIPTMKYNMVVTMPGVPAITTVTWVKKNKMRMEMSVQGIATVGLFDFDAKIMYTYMPAQNLAMKASLDQTSKTAAQEAASIAGYNPKNLGTESINGIVSYVLEYNADGNMAKVWISKDRGLPVRTENTTTDGKIISEFKDYEFSDIPDSMFELPSGVQIMQVGQ